MNINKIYVVNLDDHVDRWKLFEDLNLNITRFPAIDTRVNPFVFLNYNLALNPVDKNNEHYFSQSKGAIGCYLSHYSIWKKIIENNYESVLILEDDANPLDVKNFLENIEKDFLNNYDIVQLAKRNQHRTDLVNYFCGTSSYYCNKKAAQVLINATHDFSEMDGYEIPILPWRIQKQKLENCDLIHKQYNTFILKNSIRVPVDTFIGLNSCNKICQENQLKIKHEPLIGLNDDFESSDILAKNTKHHFEMSCDELYELELTKNYKWWENNPNKRSFNRREFTVIVSAQRHGSTTLCKKLNSVPQSVNLFEAFNAKQGQLYKKHYTDLSIEINEFLDSNDWTNKKYVSFKVFRGHGIDLEKLFTCGLSLRVVFLRRPLEDSYSSLIESLKTGNWGTNPDKKRTEEGLTGYKLDSDDIIDFETYSRQQQEWFSSTKELVEKYNIPSKEIWFDSVIQKSFDYKNLLVGKW